MLLCDIESRPPKSLDEIIVGNSLPSLDPRWNIDLEFKIPHSHVLNASLEVNRIGIVGIGIYFREEEERMLEQNTDEVTE